MPSQKTMKDVSLNEPISVELPAHIWHGFIAAYLNTKWKSDDTSLIVNAVIDQLYDPVFLKEREAEHSEHHDMHRSMFRSFFTGEPPEVPPHMEEGNL